MKRLRDFVIDMFSGDSPVSSKRVFGGIGFLAFIIMVYIWKEKDLLTILLVTSASLLGLETITNAFKSRTDRPPVVESPVKTEPEPTSNPS